MESNESRITGTNPPGNSRKGKFRVTLGKVESRRIRAEVRRGKADRHNRTQEAIMVAEHLGTGAFAADGPCVKPDKQTTKCELHDLAFGIPPYGWSTTGGAIDGYKPPAAPLPKSMGKARLEGSISDAEAHAIMLRNAKDRRELTVQRKKAAAKNAEVLRRKREGK